MATIFLTDASAGAPVLSGTNGALCTVLDWALVQNAWAVEFTATNARVYRAGSGNRFRLHVNHDSAVSGHAALATVRGCESATTATALVDPFPTVAQIANNASTFCVSSAAGATARPYWIVLSPTFFLMAVGTTSLTTTGWDLFLFGDLAPANTEDVYATVCHIGNNTTTTVGNRGMNGVISGGAIAAKTFWCRSIDGAIKSTRGCFYGSCTASTASFCTVTGTSTARGGYGNRIMREKVGATCIGSATTSEGPLALTRRGWVPNIWNLVHIGIGSLTTDDVFTDTAYAASSSFRIAPASSAIACIFETSDTWSAPVG